MRILPIVLLRTIVFLAGVRCTARPCRGSTSDSESSHATMTESILVDAPVAKVWATVGGFCDITEWMNSPEWEDCKYLQGDSGPWYCALDRK